jgi:ribosomal protein S18 acetylase RimI-like enzyme
MTAADARNIARLRLESADQGLLAQLGIGPVERFMRLAADDRDSFGAVAVEDDRLIGYILCTTASIRLQRRALRSAPALWLRLPLLALKRPRLLRLGLGRLRALLRRSPTVDASEEPPLRLFDITVAPSARGRGVGRALLDDALAEARRRRHQAVGLTVLRDNVPAIRLYESVGFAVHRTGTRDDGRPYVTMRHALGGPPAAGS